MNHCYKLFTYINLILPTVLWNESHSYAYFTGKETCIGRSEYLAKGQAGIQTQFEPFGFSVLLMTVLMLSIGDVISQLENIFITDEDVHGTVF